MSDRGDATMNASSNSFSTREGNSDASFASSSDLLKDSNGLEDGVSINNKEDADSFQGGMHFYDIADESSQKETSADEYQNSENERLCLLLTSLLYHIHIYVAKVCELSQPILLHN